MLYFKALNFDFIIAENDALMSMLNYIRFWYRNSRPRALPQSVIPALIAIALAVGNRGFSLMMAITAVMGVVFAHLGSNLFDDYFDYKKKKNDHREELKHQGFRARINKSPYITSGKAGVGDLLKAATVFFIIGGLLALVLVYFRGTTILLYIAATLVLGLSYSAWPIRFSYRGMGELLIGFMFGPLLMSGVYYSACGEFEPRLLSLFIPVGLLVMNIIYVHAMMDMVPDQQVGKMTMAVKIGSKNINLALLILINLLPYAILSYAILQNMLSRYYFLVFIALPLTFSLIYLMVMYYKDPDRKFSGLFLFGPQKDYRFSQQVGNDWFMIRWLLARNLTVYFSVIIIIVTLFLK